MNKKRLLSYIFDVLMLAFIIFLIGLVIKTDNKTIILENSLSDLNILLTNRTINFLEYLKRYSLIIHDIDINRAFYSITNSFFIIVYFVLIPFYRGGETYGQSIFKICVVSDDSKYVSIKQLMIRSLVFNGLLYMLLSLMLLYIVPKNLYFLIVSILGIIQLFIVIKSAFMIRYSENNKGLHDIISNTSVVENKEVK